MNAVNLQSAVVEGGTAFWLPVMGFMKASVESFPVRNGPDTIRKGLPIAFGREMHTIAGMEDETK